MNKKQKIIIVGLMMSILFLFAYLWTYKLSSVVYEGNYIPNDLVNEHTLQGAGLLWLVFIFVYSLSNSFLVSLILGNLALGLLYYANIVKFEQRGDVIHFYEFGQLANIKELADIVSLKAVFILLSIALPVLLLVLVLSRKFSKKYKLCLPPVLRIASILFILLSSLVIYSSSTKAAQVLFSLNPPEGQTFNIQKEVKKAGDVPYFVQNISKKFMAKPNQYSDKKINEITEKYQLIAEAGNKSRNKDIRDERTIIYLSESLWDYESILENGPAAPYINELKNAYGGNMYSQFIGGGTANLEFSVLTSMSLELHEAPTVTTPYTEYYEKSPTNSSFLGIYPETERAAIHPFTYALYNRQGVYKQMGINHMLDQSDMPDARRMPVTGRIKDEYLTEYLVKKIPEYAVINTLSMQNHSTYPANLLPDSSFVPEIKPGILSEEPTASAFGDYVEYGVSYFKELRETDSAIEGLITSMESSEDKINLVLYGDHSPSFMRGNEEAVGDDVYRTPYFIYRNHGEDQPKTKQVSQLSPIFLMPELLSRDNYKMPPFYYLMTELYQQGVTQIGADYIYLNGEQKFDKDLNKEIQTLVTDYRLLSYDRFFDKNQATDDFYMTIK
ncbi:LTA synthase family protein [Vagococcus salmoninarum]|uniref:Sulfatase N-terminal domain-containing protein n=1 Tax=Vagococcus salmoninarum TaxID=2739 RepID=A0A429ZMS1_9ENTE|nr:LTA synthase family protein [Vagococcus salmoninarum]RST94968.1 hypothetical protein CBF35_08850 [Vagococcus salmoninarum]